MTDRLSTLLTDAVVWVTVLALWSFLYRRGKLRIRLMATTVAAAVFVQLTAAEVFLIQDRVVAPLGFRALADKIAISALSGGTVLLWWPILGKGLRRIGIRW